MSKALTIGLFLSPWILCGTYFCVFMAQRTSPSYVAVCFINDNHVDVLLQVVCLVVPIFSFIGFVSIRLEIYRFLFTVIVCVPLALFVPAMCGYCFWYLRALPDNIETIIKSDLNQKWTNSSVNKYLNDFQIRKECCGLYGPSDFREFIYKKSYCRTTKQDVPYSCLPLEFLNDKCNDETGPNGFCLKSNFIVDALYFKDNSTDLNTNPDVNIRIRYKCDHMKSSNFAINRIGIRSGVLKHKGCLEPILQSCREIVEGHFIYFGLVLLFSIFLAIVYFSLWISDFQSVKQQLMQMQQSERNLDTLGYVVID